MKQIKLHFGCGKKYLEGYINCDMLTTIKTDISFDMNVVPYPFRNNYADEILMDMVLEHVDDVPAVMQETHRILKKNGVVKIYVPYAKSEWAYQDPTHKHFFNEKSMLYFADDYAYNYYTDSRFTILKNTLYTSKDTMLSRMRNSIPFRNILKHFFFNMYDGIYFEMKAVK
jgi:ubiquinone/menaquinone biosynthesis C-methylase UbiE